MQTSANRCVLPASTDAAVGGLDGGTDGTGSGGANDGGSGTSATCGADQLCLACAAEQNCEQGTGICARLSLEKRDCVLACGGNGDCRAGYVCQATGTGGTVALTLNPDPAAAPKFCAPALPSQ